MKKQFYIILLFLTICSLNGLAQTTYTKVTSASGLEAGANYLIVAHYDDLGVLAMSYQKANNRHAVVVSENDESITITPGTDPASETDVFQFTLGGSTGAWTLFDEVKGGYLYAASSSSNNLKTQTALDANGKWSIIFDAEGTAEVVAQGENTRNYMRFNPNTQNNAALFSCYSETSTIGALVSLYKAGGGIVTPDPEPSNYPTNFAATVDGTDVTLTWTDVIGSQLPDKYLVLASTDAIIVPIDGTPIANSALAMNVNYGVETVTFGGLQGGVTYKFAIFPYTNSGSNIDYKTDGNYPTTIGTTEQITTLFFENFDEELGVFTAHNLVGEQEWHHGEYQGTTYANMNGYSGGANDNEDWLISPAISSQGYQDAYLSFSTAMKFEGEPLRVKVSINYDGEDNPEGFAWIDITDMFEYSIGNYEWVESGAVNIWDVLDGYGLGYPNFYVAFVYNSTLEDAASWEIDFVKIETLTNYIISVAANPFNGGLVYVGNTPGTTQSSYTNGQSCTVQVTANSGYTFTNWTENGTVVSSNASYTFTVNANRTLVANFTYSPQNYTITVSANPTNGGNVAGGGTYSSGSTRTVTATPNANYTFANWTENGSVVSTNASYTFTLNANRNLVANFTYSPQNYTITVSANPPNGGNVAGGGTFSSGSTRTVTATPNTNYTFSNWTENGNVVSTNASYTFTLNANRNLVANFTANAAPTYTITANAEPSNGGSITGAGTYSEGETCVLLATPNENYIFENWTRNGNEVSRDPRYEFPVNRDLTFVAHFTQDNSHFTITAMADPIEGGSVSGGGTYESGATCALNAIAAEGYEFINWTSNGIQVSTEPSFSVTVTSNAVYVAHFRRSVNHYTITVNVEPTSAGSVIGAGTFEEGATCTLIPMPNPTYSFVCWTENGIIVSTDNPYSFVVNQNRNLVAVFHQELFYTITASAGPDGIITPDGEVMVLPGNDKTFNFIPDDGYSVNKVIVDGVDRGALPSYTFRNVNENHSIHVQFSGLGVDDNIITNLEVYPNPAQDKINIESPNMKKVAVFNLLGVLIESKKVNDDYAVISTNEFPQGTYILKVEYLDGSVGYSRFMVAK